MRGIDGNGLLMHILMHICGKTCQEGSRVVASDPQGESVQTAVPVPSGQGLSLSDDLESLVEVAGVEPASRDLSKTVSTHVVFFMVLSPVQEGTPTRPRLPSTV